jgi:hypothetical protein
MTSQIEKGPEGVEKLFPNVDRWGAAEWFERLVNAVAKRDEAVLSKDDGSFEIYNNIASSSASVLAREHAPDIRRALTATGESKTESSPEVTEAMHAIDVLREWFGGDRYARDYEYINANYMEQARKVAAFAALSVGREGAAQGRDATTHRHVKRGSKYELLGIGKMQSEMWLEQGEGTIDSPSPLEPIDMREVAIYRSIDDGSLWVRPREEFEDGRFAALDTSPEGMVEERI